MSSTDGRRAAGEAGVDAEPAGRAGPVTGSDNGAADGAASDPWFTPGPKADSPGVAVDPAATAEWFLPTGRAGLLPESMTESADDDQSAPPTAQYRARTEAAGAPPWAGEVTFTGPAAEAPPPWETGPWPGPGEIRASSTVGGLAHGEAASGGAAANGRTAAAGTGRQSLTGQPQSSGAWSARTILASGLVPLVIPGLLAGVLGIRRSSSGEPVRRASILAIAASLVWAVIIVLLVASNSGGSPGGCRYPAAVHQTYAQVMADLGTHAPATHEIADLGLAASRANAAAAATVSGDVSVRSALFAMAGDLQQARADLIASRKIPASLRARLAADGTALTASCPS